MPSIPCLQFARLAAVENLFTPRARRETYTHGPATFIAVSEAILHHLLPFLQGFRCQSRDTHVIWGFNNWYSQATVRISSKGRGRYTSSRRTGPSCRWTRRSLLVFWFRTGPSPFRRGSHPILGPSNSLDLTVSCYNLQIILIAMCCFHLIFHSEGNTTWVSSGRGDFAISELLKFVRRLENSPWGLRATGIRLCWIWKRETDVLSNSG